MNDEPQDIQRALRALTQLHHVDQQLSRIDDASETLPARRAAAEADMAGARRVLEAKQAEQAAAERGKRDAEGELAASIQRIQERETKLYAIKTNKEYQAALKEIAEGKKANREREDQILKCMETIEAVAKEIAQLLRTAADTTDRCREALAQLDAEAARLRQERVGIAAERERVIGDVPVDVLRTYEQIRGHHRDAVAEVTMGVCQGCNMRIPPQQYLELQRWTLVGQCPSCRRILCPSNPVPAAPAPEKNGMFAEK